MAEYWRPAALDRDPVAYPEYPFPNAASGAKKRQPLHVARDKAVARTGPQFSYTNTPWGTWAGPGSYFPGHAGEDQQLGKGNMAAALHQSEAAKAQSRLQGAGYGAGGGGGGSYAGGGGGMSGNGLYDSFQNARNQANQANEARYADLLGGSQSLAERSMGYLDGIGTQQQADTDQAFKRQAAALQQNMINRGLSNSTVADTMAMGNERERLAEQRRLQADLNQQRLSTDAAMTNNTLGIMERREDEGPSYELLAQLAMGLGQGGMGDGGGGVMMGAPIYASPGDLGFNIPGRAWGMNPAMMGGSYPMPTTGSMGGSRRTPASAKRIASLHERAAGMRESMLNDRAASRGRRAFIDASFAGLEPGESVVIDGKVYTKGYTGNRIVEDAG